MTRLRDRTAMAALAAVLATGMSACWAVADGARLSALILPDPDDAMRLAQIRDWIGGQALADTAQYRMGPAGGVAMHWSRLPDLIPGAIITLLQPLIGRPDAEWLAILLWPALLLAITLWLLAAIARRWSDIPAAGPVAMALAVLAYPMTGYFLPGRIDHHNLQIVLLLIAATGRLRGDGRGGMASGAALALALAVGLESAPLHAMLFAGAVVEWIWTGARRGGTWLVAAGAALTLTTAIVAAVLAPPAWPWTLCDGFTPPIAILAGAAGIGLILLGLAGHRLERRSHRIGAAIVVALAFVPIFATVARPCLAGPYGQVPPLLRALWLAHVAEAQPPAHAGLATAIGQMGLMLAGCVAMLIRLARRPDRRAVQWAAMQLACLAVTSVQMRLAPFGAALAVPVLAAAIVAVRRQGRPWATVALWAASAGILYPLAGTMLARRGDGGPPRPDCLTPAHLRRIAALGPVRLAVPIDLGPHVLTHGTATTLAGPYHRNAAGNLAQFRLFLGSAAVVRAQLAATPVDAIAYCPAWIGDLDPGHIAAPDSIVARAATGRLPDWAGGAEVRNGLVILPVRR